MCCAPCAYDSGLIRVPALAGWLAAVEHSLHAEQTSSD